MAPSSAAARAAARTFFHLLIRLDRSRQRSRNLSPGRLRSRSCFRARVETAQPIARGTAPCPGDRRRRFGCRTCRGRRGRDRGLDRPAGCARARACRVDRRDGTAADRRADLPRGRRFRIGRVPRACGARRASQDAAPGHGRTGERGAGDGRGAARHAPRVGYLMERQTESRNPRARNLGKMSTRQILQLINDEDATIAAVVRAAIPQIERAVEMIVSALASGHRLFYVGAGTSGRLGVLDASEMPPTFGVEPELVTGIIAGGDHALRMSIEGAEDQAWAGTRDLGDVCRSGDVVVGISASGRAPYVLAAIEHAKPDFDAVGTIAITCNPDSELARAADVAIVIDVGPEVIAGSSRMKAGTATKLVLNMLSTTSMVKLGRTRDDLMVDLRATNEKLRQRAIQLVEQEAHVPADEAQRRLEKWGWHVRAAIADRWPAS